MEEIKNAYEKTKATSNKQKQLKRALVVLSHIRRYKEIQSEMNRRLKVYESGFSALSRAVMVAMTIALPWW